LVRFDALMHRVEGFEVNPDAEHARAPRLLDGTQQLIETIVESTEIDSIQVTMGIKKHSSRVIFRKSHGQTM